MYKKCFECGTDLKYVNVNKLPSVSMYFLIAGLNKKQLLKKKRASMSSSQNGGELNFGTFFAML